jgi:hypothetical protein
MIQTKNKINFSLKIILKYWILFFVIINYETKLFSQNLPEIINNKKIATENYLPDFSFAGYQFGEKPVPKISENIILATDFGVIPNDGLDDSKSLLKAIEVANKVQGNVVLQLPAGKLILSTVLYLERSNFVLRGAGTGVGGTEIFCPRPMMYFENPTSLNELREYLVEFDKRQIEKENNIDLPFSQYAWSGGFIWTQVPGERVKSYLGKYDTPQVVLAKVVEGKRGEHIIEVSETDGLNVGDVVQLELFNTEGEQGAIILDLYKNTNVKVGSHHWAFPALPIVRQQVQITSINKNKVTIKSPLTISIKPSYKAQLVEWKHLKEVGIEHFKITFPSTPYVAHHVEQGYNGIFLTRVFNSWVNDIVIENAESGILTEEIANVTIQNIVTQGSNLAHYTVAMAGVHNVLVKNLKVFNNAVHPLSFNTFSTKNVYQQCEVFVNPVLDQHSGANHQNLFDNITVYLSPLENNTYPLFAGGGAGYWKPSHGSYSTFWNLNVQLLSKLDLKVPIELNGMKDGPFSRIIGVHGNHSFIVRYEPNSYQEFINLSINLEPSLYNYQLKSRIKK